MEYKKQFIVVAIVIALCLRTSASSDQLGRPVTFPINVWAARVNEKYTVVTWSPAPEPPSSYKISPVIGYKIYLNNENRMKYDAIDIDANVTDYVISNRDIPYGDFVNVVAVNEYGEGPQSEIYFIVADQPLFVGQLMKPRVKILFKNSLMLRWDGLTDKEAGHVSGYEIGIYTEGETSLHRIQTKKQFLILHRLKINTDYFFLVRARTDESNETWSPPSGPIRFED